MTSEEATKIIGNTRVDNSPSTTKEMHEIISAWSKGSNVDFIMPSSEDSIKDAKRLEDLGMKENDKKKREQYFERANYHRSLAALYKVLSARQRKGK